MSCRCGWNGVSQHPCHARAYTCKKPAKRRFYATKLVALAGNQFKTEAADTFACDECWEEFKAKRPSVKMKN